MRSLHLSNKTLLAGSRTGDSDGKPRKGGVIQVINGLQREAIRSDDRGRPEESPRTIRGDQYSAWRLREEAVSAGTLNRLSRRKSETQAGGQRTRDYIPSEVLG